MVRAVVLVAQDRMTRPLSTFPRSSPERRQREEEDRRQRVMVITEFDAGDPEATLHALAGEILKYRRALQLAGSGDRLGVRRPPAEFGVIGAFADPKGQLRPPSPTTG